MKKEAYTLAEEKLFRLEHALCIQNEILQNMRVEGLEKIDGDFFFKIENLTAITSDYKRIYQGIDAIVFLAKKNTVASNNLLKQIEEKYYLSV